MLFASFATLFETDAQCDMVKLQYRKQRLQCNTVRRCCLAPVVASDVFITKNADTNVTHNSIIMMFASFATLFETDAQCDMVKLQYRKHRLHYADVVLRR